MLSNSNITAQVDDEDLERLSKFSWRLMDGAVYRSEWRVNKVHSISLPQEIMHKENQMYDHADKNFLNNQKINLREATWSQNNHNRTKLAWARVEYVGVDIMRRRNKRFRVRIKKDKKQIYIGLFFTAEEAAKAYDAKARELYGEFANVNFPL